MALVAGVSWTRHACAVLIRDAATGRVMRTGTARHDAGSVQHHEVDPGVWWDSLQQALTRAGGLHDVSAVSCVGTAHSVVFLDARGSVIGPSPLGAPAHRAATHIITSTGTGDLVERVGVVPDESTPSAVISWWCHEHPDAATRLAAVALPHEWLAWRLRGGGPGYDPADMVTDRSAATSSGLCNPVSGRYDVGLVELVAGRPIRLPHPLLPGELGGRAADGLIVAPGASHRAAVALGLAMRPGDVVLDLDLQGCAAAVISGAPRTGHVPVRYVADADSHVIAEMATRSVARALATAAATLGVDGTGLATLALQAPPGSDGVVSAAGRLTGLRDAPNLRALVARAVIEGVLVDQADALDSLTSAGAEVARVLLIGPAARNQAVVSIAPTVLAYPIEVPLHSDHALDGATIQAAWVLHGARPAWVPAMAVRLSPDVEPGIAAARRAVDRQADSHSARDL